MKNRILTSLSIVFPSLLIFTGCGTNQSNFTVLGAELTPQGGSIVIAGSTTVAPIAQVLADSFMETHPGYRIEVQSMGTGAGMTAAIEGVADIGLASRDLNPDELEYLDFVTFAIDGIAVVVNQSNPVEDLSFDEIQGIFLGEITNWSQVGGADADIIVVSREAGSGARGSFESLAGVTDEVYYMLIGVGSNSTVTHIEQNRHAIGYVTYSIVETRSVNSVSVGGVAFSSESALSGDYPFAIGFHMAFDIEGVSPETQIFLDWVMSPAGQAVVAEAEYVPVQ